MTTTTPPSSRPWSHDIGEGHWDAIVIGSGMGGMTAAGLLARLGERVLVLERHNIPGGFTQTFKRPGYRWDVGVHIVGEMTERSFPGRLLADLTRGRLEWEPVGPVYDEFHFPDGFTIRFPDSPEAFRETLCEHFPEERSGIDEYLSLVRRAARATARHLQLRALPWYLTRGDARKASDGAEPFVTATTRSVLESLVDDPRLRSVLAAQWGYYGLPPSRSSFAMHALMVQHFIHGAFYPAGTAASIAPALLQTVADAGGWTAVRRPVDRILRRRGRAAGVRLADGTELEAPSVISAVGAVQTERLLGEGIVESPTYRRTGPAHVSLYLGFANADIEDLGAERFCQWYYASWDTEVVSWDVEPGVEPRPSPVLFCSFPSTKDPRHRPGPELHHTGEAITFVPWAAFERWQGSRWKRRGTDYEAFKEQLTERLLTQYLEHYPRLAPHVDHVEMSTPVSTQHFTAAPHGSIYGLATAPERFADVSLVARTPVRGLALAGADAGTPGVAGAMIGGVLGAVAVEPVRAGRYVQGIMSKGRP